MNPLLLTGLKTTKFLKGSRTTASYQLTKLVEDLKLFLSTEKGTLWGRPDYGTRIQEYLFEPVTEETGESIRLEVYNALKRSYPELNVQQVDIILLEDGIKVNIYYAVNQNGLSQLLEFDILRERR